MLQHNVNVIINTDNLTLQHNVNEIINTDNPIQ